MNRIAIALCVTLALLAGSRFFVSAAADDKDDTHALIGKAAPDFKLSTADKKEAKLADFKGKVTLVDFWATWCPPCRASLPHLQSLSDNKELAEKGFKVLAVSTDEEDGTAAEYLKKNNLSFTTPLDLKGTVAESYKVKYFPTTVLIGRDGKVKEVFVGYSEAIAKKVDEAVEAAVKEKAPGAT